MKDSNFKLKKYLLLLSGILLVINLIQAYLSPLIDDEAYYWMWSERLAWGYFDHPPMVAWWVKVGFSILNNELGVRLLTAIFGSVSVYLLGLILSPKNKNEFKLFTVLVLSFVLLNVYQFITTPDAPLIFFTILYLFVLKRFLKTNTWANAMSLGLCMSLLIYAKYHGILVIMFTLIPLVFSQIKNIKFYVAVLVGITLYIPHLHWQNQNDWVSFNYHLFNRTQNNGFEFRFLYEYLINLIWVCSPLLFYHLTKAIFKHKVSNRFETSLKWLCLGIVGFFLLSTFGRAAQPQWTLVAFIPFIMIGFFYYKNKTNQHKIIQILGIVGIVLICLVRIDFMLPNPPVKTPFHGTKEFMQTAGKVEGFPVFEKYQTTSLFNFYNYPKKHAANYETLANRKSQYNLWNSGKEIHNQNITYFSKYAKSWKDSIVWKNNKNTAYYYNSMDSMQMAHRLKFDVEEILAKKDSVFLQLKITNHHQRTVELNQKNKLKVFVVYSKGRHITTYRQALKLGSIFLKPNETTTLNVGYKQTDKTGEHQAYIGLAPKGMPVKKQSDWFTVFVK